MKAKFKIAHMKAAQVYEGQERVEECPVWQEFVHYNEIKVYK